MIKSKNDAQERMVGRGTFSHAFNLASVPALSVPCGFVSVGCKELPIGLQIAGRPFEDALVLKVAHAYEQSTSWHHKYTPGFGPED